MSSYPQDFSVPLDQGGPGQGQPVGGFGGNPAADRSAHRDAVERVGKAPVILVHGNGASADTPPWDMMALKGMLLDAGYGPELVWAPSYLGTGTLDLATPHTDNINELRDYIDSVCGYLDVSVVDTIAHSLGCTMVYSVCRGLEKRTTPVNWSQPNKWHRVGTMVALAGAFHGLGGGGVGEWKTGAEFMNELLTETLGGGGENPFAEGKPQTLPPAPHNITYFCGIATRDFIDAQNPGTGRLAGAINRDYNLGTGQEGHKKIKENQAVFNDFLPHLNSVPPVPAVTLTVDQDTGSYPSPLAITVAVTPPDRIVDVTANRLTKEYLNGFITDKVSETHHESLGNGQAVTLATEGMWQLSLSVAGAADDLKKTYWIGVAAVDATIVTDNTPPFDKSLLVVAKSSDPTATLYYSLDGAMWNEGATVVIEQDSAVRFIAINSAGVASDVVARSFTKQIPWQDAVTANANDHFIAGRIDVTEYLAYSRQFGSFTPFTLYLVNGSWVLDPQRAAPNTFAEISVGHPTAVETRTLDVNVADGRPVIRVNDGDPQPGKHSGPLTVTIAAVADTDERIRVHYSRDGSLPNEQSPTFVGSQRFELPEAGNHIIACYAKDSDGNETYQTFHYATGR